VEIEKSKYHYGRLYRYGKTLLAVPSPSCSTCRLPFVDATVFTEAGYVGEDVESILSRLLQVANYDVAAAERGIVLHRRDRQDCAQSDNHVHHRDVRRRGCDSKDCSSCWRVRW
jgi:ATP-dependent Clp protease ATP-binding subunit ClpX